MIARKIKPGVLELIDVQSIDEIESYTLLEVTDKDAYLLLASSKEFSKDGNTTTINYESGDATDIMFKAIAQKRKEENPTNFIDVSKKYYIDKDVHISGTSVLIRDPKKHIIRVGKRSTTNSKEGTINRLFVDNVTRDKFFDDARVSKRHNVSGKFEIDPQDYDNYKYWSAYMNEEYFRIMSTIMLNKKVGNK